MTQSGNGNKGIITIKSKVDDKTLKKLKMMFRPSPKHEMVTIDYSDFESRWAAEHAKQLENYLSSAITHTFNGAPLGPPARAPISFQNPVNNKLYHYGMEIRARHDMVLDDKLVPRDSVWKIRTHDNHLSKVVIQGYLPSLPTNTGLGLWNFMISYVKLDRVFIRAHAIQSNPCSEIPLHNYPPIKLDPPDIGPICEHKHKRHVVISSTLQYWYCPDCKEEVDE